VVAANASILSNGTHFPDINGWTVSVWYFADIDDTDTWTSEIKNAVAAFWQGDQADTDKASVTITSNTVGGVRARGGAVFTFDVESANTNGWLLVIHGS
jgi:hypothetical protein